MLWEQSTQGSRITMSALHAISDELEYLQCKILDNEVLPFPEPLGMDATQNGAISSSN
jgi:hypothetical protein